MAEEMAEYTQKNVLAQALGCYVGTGKSKTTDNPFLTTTVLIDLTLLGRDKIYEERPFRLLRLG